MLRRGPAPQEARLVVVMVHGRNAAASNIVGLSDELELRDVAYLAPSAPGGSWYPYSFLAELDRNEPQLSAALGLLDGLTSDLLVQGVPYERMALLGFSQGACLSLEFAARHARRYAAVIGLTGGLIGPPGTPRNYSGAFDGTPVFLGCSDRDSHVPLERVHESSDVFRRLGARVIERIYPGMGHLVSREELDEVRAILGA